MKINRTFGAWHISTQKPVEKGFTLIELMIVIAIVAILATVAIPSYQNYTKKAAMSELLQAAAPYRSEVELCIYNTNGVSNCTAGSNGIQDNTDERGKYVKSVKASSGVSTVTGKGALDGISYKLTAAGNAADGVTWTADCGTNAELFPAGFCS